MIWSVSTFGMSIGAASAVSLVKASMSLLRHQAAHVGEVSRDGGGGGHSRADEMGTAALALPAGDVADRTCVVSGHSASVSVDPGGRRLIKNKPKESHTIDR